MPCLTHTGMATMQIQPSLPRRPAITRRPSRIWGSAVLKSRRQRSICGWRRNKSWQSCKLGVLLDQRSCHCYAPFLLASLHPEIQRVFENGHGMFNIPMIHCAEMRDDDFAVTELKGATGVRHQIAIRAVNLKSQKDCDNLLIVVPPFFVAGHAPLTGFAY